MFNDPNARVVRAYGKCRGFGMECEVCESLEVVEFVNVGGSKLFIYQ